MGFIVEQALGPHRCGSFRVVELAHCEIPRSTYHRQQDKAHPLSYGQDQLCSPLIIFFCINIYRSGETRTTPPKLFGQVKARFL